MPECEHVSPTASIPSRARTLLPTFSLLLLLSCYPLLREDILARRSVTITRAASHLCAELALRLQSLWELTSPITRASERRETASRTPLALPRIQFSTCGFCASKPWISVGVATPM